MVKCPTSSVCQTKIPVRTCCYFVAEKAPYTCRNFYACAFTRFQKPQQLGRARRACSLRHVRIAASRARSQQPALLQAVAETAGEEESCSSSSSLQSGWSARMATRWSSHRLACSIRYRSLHVSLPANDSCDGLLASPSTLFAGGYLQGRQNHKSSFCSERGENLVTIVRFGKPLFADMHHRVHAVAGALQKPNVACPHPDVSTGWPVMRSTLRSHSADASCRVLTFGRPNLLLHLHHFFP